MNKLNNLVDDFQTELNDTWSLESEIYTQDEIKTMLEECSNEFPMICFENTKDSDFIVDISESKFLNDESHEGKWIVIEPANNIGIICLKENNDALQIDVFEINMLFRGIRFSRQIIEALEISSKKYYKKIVVVPFDSSAYDFWEHFEYKNNGYEFEKDI